MLQHSSRVSELRRRALAGAALAFFVPSFATRAQSVTAVENLGSVSGAQVYSGLGFNINPNNEWEFQLAAAAGAVEVRMQFSWEAVENMAGVLALSTASETALNRCAQYGLQPLIVAAYGGPRQRILTLTVASDLPSGSYVIPVSEDVSAINVPFCHVQRSGGAQIVPTGKWAYYGALIDSVDTANRTLTLAARTNVALAAGDTLWINRLLYASCPTTDPNDPSVAAYARYVQFLASRIDDHGLAGRVELWNEPPWAHDPWDTRYRFYDNPPPDLERTAVQFGFAKLLETTVFPGNARLNWAGSHKSGFNSLLGPRMSPRPTQNQVSNSISSESFHPYGNTPEDHAWEPTCLADFSHSEFTCNLVGTNASSNLKSAVRYDLRNQIDNGWMVEQNITETGRSTANQIGKARFVLRQYLSFQALGIPRINFYRLADAGGIYGFVDSNSQTALQAYTAMQGLIGDAGAISNPALPYGQGDLPSVLSYRGYYPLTVAVIVGTSSPSDTMNSFLFTCWQRSYPTSGDWLNLPSPDPMPVTLQLPSGVAARYAYNLNSRENIPITVSGSQVTFKVADDPVALLVIPM